jgi:hypothetical protein
MLRTALFLILALTLAACQGAKPDPTVIAANRAIYEQIRDGRIDAVKAQMPPGADTPEMAAALARLRTLAPAGAPQGAKVITASILRTDAFAAAAVVVEYDYPDRTARFATTLQQPRGKTAWRLSNVQLQVATHKALAPNTLSLDHRSIGQLGFLALAITSPMLMLAALIKVLRTQGLANRGLWAAFAFVGLFSFQMNWASGGVLAQWMALQIVGFWMTSSPSRFDPWVIGATVPIGALLILAGLVARPGRVST